MLALSYINIYIPISQHPKKHYMAQPAHEAEEEDARIYYISTCVYVDIRKRRQRGCDTRSRVLCVSLSPNPRTPACTYPAALQALQTEQASLRKSEGEKEGEREQAREMREREARQRR
jgi:hypothetical protein